MVLRQRATATQARLEIQFPLDWLEGLSNLLKSLQKPQFRRVASLCVALAGDFEGGMMLRHLLSLLPRSKREDGAVYKSATEWQAELGVTANQVYRVNKHVLPQLGFDITVKKAHGAPTNHYRLNAWAFLRRLSDVLDLPAYYLLLKMQKAANGFTGKQPMDLLESSQSLTDSTTSKTTKQESVNDSGPSIKVVDFKSPSPESTPEQLRVIELLTQAGLRNPQAVSFALLPETIVQACIASTQAKGKNVGYLIGALRNQLKAQNTQPSSESAVTDTPPPNPLPVAAAETNDGAEVSERGQVLQEKFTGVLRRLPDAATKPPPVAEVVNENLLAIVAGSMTVEAAWSAAYHQLELQLDRASFDTWLRSAQLLDYEDGVLVVGVHNSYARDMLQHRLYRNVARILRDATGQEIAIRFEVWKGGKQITDDEAKPEYGLKRFLKTDE